MMVVVFLVPSLFEFCSFQWAFFMGLRLTEAQTCANARKFDCQRPSWAVFGLLSGLARVTGWVCGYWDWGRGFLMQRYGLGWLVGALHLPQTIGTCGSVSGSVIVGCKEY